MWEDLPRLPPVTTELGDSVFQLRAKLFCYISIEVAFCDSKELAPVLPKEFIDGSAFLVVQLD